MTAPAGGPRAAALAAVGAAAALLVVADRWAFEAFRDLSCKPGDDTGLSCLGGQVWLVVAGSVTVAAALGVALRLIGARRPAMAATLSGLLLLPGFALTVLPALPLLLGAGIGRPDGAGRVVVSVIAAALGGAAALTPALLLLRRRRAAALVAAAWLAVTGGTVLVDQLATSRRLAGRLAAVVPHPYRLDGSSELSYLTVTRLVVNLQYHDPSRPVTDDVLIAMFPRPAGVDPAARCAPGVPDTLFAERRACTRLALPGAPQATAWRFEDAGAGLVVLEPDTVIALATAADSSAAGQAALAARLRPTTAADLVAAARYTDGA
jgi:hypothetical protein